MAGVKIIGRCICDEDNLLTKITGKPLPLAITQINKIRLNLFTERNSDGTGYLKLRGRDMFDRYGIRIQDSDIRAISIYVSESPRRVTYLDLSYNEITDVGFYKLLKRLLIKGRSSIVTLNIMNNNLGAESMKYLSRYASSIKLKSLRINGNEIGPEGAEHFASFLVKNRTVQHVDIGQSDLTLSTIAPIMAALRNDCGKNDAVTVLDINRIVPLSTRLSYETRWLAYHIELLLERNKTLIELHLQKNELIGHDIEYFVRGLRTNNTLLYLDLGYNKIGEYGVELIAKYLTEGPPLIFLNVAGNGIRDTAASALSISLAYSKIRVLDISHNKINDKGLLDIFQFSKKPFNLTLFNIWGNNINHITCVVIKEMLDAGVIFQETIDIKIYEVDEILYAAYHPNAADRNRSLYYCDLDYGYAQPIYRITRNTVPENKKAPVY